MNGPGKTIVTVSGMDELDSFKTIHTIKWQENLETGTATRTEEW
jgi:hypothetical protein